jgi:hypothetical protein
MIRGPVNTGRAEMIVRTRMTGDGRRDRESSLGCFIRQL